VSVDQSHCPCALDSATVVVRPPTDRSHTLTKAMVCGKERVEGRLCACACRSGCASGRRVACGDRETAGGARYSERAIKQSGGVRTGGGKSKNLHHDR